jgi:hypothetical protein
VERLAPPIASWLDGSEELPGGPIQPFITRLKGAGTRVIPAGRRSISISVLVAATATKPTILPVADPGDEVPTAQVLPEGAQVVLVSDFPGDQLAGMTVSTGAGDDVLIIETYLNAS